MRWSCRPALFLVVLALALTGCGKSKSTTVVGNWVLDPHATEFANSIAGQTGRGWSEGELRTRLLRLILKKDGAYVAQSGPRSNLFSLVVTEGTWKKTDQSIELTKGVRNDQPGRPFGRTWLVRDGWLEIASPGGPRAYLKREASPASTWDGMADEEIWNARRGDGNTKRTLDVKILNAWRHDRNESILRLVGSSDALCALLKSCLSAGRWEYLHLRLAQKYAAGDPGPLSVALLLQLLAKGGPRLQIATDAGIHHPLQVAGVYLAWALDQTWSDEVFRQRLSAKKYILERFDLAYGEYVRDSKGDSASPEHSVRIYEYSNDLHRLIERGETGPIKHYEW